MAYKLVGSTLGGTTFREVYCVYPCSMPGPYKYWGLRIHDAILVGSRRGRTTVVDLICHSQKEVERRIKQRLMVVP